MIGVFSPCRSVRLLLALIFVFLLFWSLGFICLSKASSQSSEVGEPTASETETSTEGAASETPIDKLSGSTPTPTISPTPTSLSETPTATSTSESPTPTTASYTPTFTDTTELPIFAAGSETPTITAKPTIGISLAQNISSPFSSDEVVIRLSPPAAPADIKSCLDTIDGRVDMEIEELNVLILKVPVGKVLELIAHLSNCPGVEYAEPNYIARIADTIPSDPGFVNQYGLISIRAPQGWDLSTGSSSVIIAVVDTGVDLSHPDLASKIVPGYGLLNSTPVPPDDDNGHGTQVAGIAAAFSNNGVGVSGVSWGARIMPVKVLNASGSGLVSDVAEGIVWAADHGAQIINLSLGVPGPSNPSVLEAAVNHAYLKGAVQVASTGNLGNNSILYPALYPHVIAVGGVDSSNNHWGLSNYGPEVSVVAPAVQIYSTTLSGGYAYNDGTSMAVPYVSGLAAILRGFSGNGSPDAITWEIELTALDLGLPGKDDLYGYGLIQMDRAIRLARPHRAATPTNTPPLFYHLFATSTFTPTWTETLTSYRTTSAALITQTETNTAGIPSFAKFTPTSTSSGVASRPTLPWTICSGLLLLGIGIWLFWIAVRMARGEHRRKYSIKKGDLNRQ